MSQSTRPFLVLYVAWHPKFTDGEGIAKALFAHYRRDLYKNIAGGAGLNVVYRSMPEPGGRVPIGIDFAEAETSAIILLIDEHFAADDAWVTWAREITERCNAEGLGRRVFPVAVSNKALRIGIVEQAARWDKWDTITHEERLRRLISDLTYQFCRMLRLYLEQLQHPLEEEAALEHYLQKVKIFLSHSKHDPNRDGERIARAIRDYLHDGDGLESFFDVHDIPTGLRFNKVILKQVKTCAVVALHTDSYSSREWCRLEIIEAKRWNVPLVVANCISNLDERGFPYMGNVPIIRMDPQAVDRIELIIGHLLDEVLKDFLWHCRVALADVDAGDRVVFLPRPPELITLASVPGDPYPEATFVYPDPPLSVEEQQLFEAIAPKVRLRSLTEWLAEDAL